MDKAKSFCACWECLQSPWSLWAVSVECLIRARSNKVVSCMGMLSGHRSLCIPACHRSAGLQHQTAAHQHKSLGWQMSAPPVPANSQQLTLGSGSLFMRNWKAITIIIWVMWGSLILGVCFIILGRGVRLKVQVVFIFVISFHSSFVVKYLIHKQRGCVLLKQRFVIYLQWGFMYKPCNLSWSVNYVHSQYLWLLNVHN